MKRSKYGAKPKVVDNIRFDSTREAAVYCQLRDLQRVGIIKKLEMQCAFLLQPAFMWEGKLVREIDYLADFVVEWSGKQCGRPPFRDSDRTDGEKTIIEVKGVKTKEYRIKIKLFKFKYPEWAGHFEEWK